MDDAANALEAAQADLSGLKLNNESLDKECDCLAQQRDAALARLVELEKQEPVAWGLWLDIKSVMPGSEWVGYSLTHEICSSEVRAQELWASKPDYYARGPFSRIKVAPLYAAAGASLQPEFTLDGMTPMQFALSELYEFQEATSCDTAEQFIAEKTKAQPSQALDAARYQWLRSTTNWASNSNNERIDVRNSPEVWDYAIDAAINAKGAV